MTWKKNMARSPRPTDSYVATACSATLRLDGKSESQSTQGRRTCTSFGLPTVEDSFDLAIRYGGCVETGVFPLRSGAGQVQNDLDSELRPIEDYLKEGRFRH